MTTWKPPHKTAQQRYAERPKKIRQIDSAALAPSVPVIPLGCTTCGHPRLAHAQDHGPCMRQVGRTARCRCDGYVAP